MTPRERQKARMAAPVRKVVDMTQADEAKRLRGWGLTKEAIGRQLGMSSVAVEALLGEGLAHHGEAA